MGHTQIIVTALIYLSQLHTQLQNILHISIHGSNTPFRLHTLHSSKHSFSTSFTTLHITPIHPSQLHTQPQHTLHNSTHTSPSFPTPTHSMDKETKAQRGEVICLIQSTLSFTAGLVNIKAWAEGQGSVQSLSRQEPLSPPQTESDANRLCPRELGWARERQDVKI